MAHRIVLKGRLVEKSLMIPEKESPRKSNISEREQPHRKPDDNQSRKLHLRNFALKCRCFGGRENTPRDNSPSLQRPKRATCRSRYAICSCAAINTTRSVVWAELWSRLPDGWDMMMTSRSCSCTMAVVTPLPTLTKPRGTHAPEGS